MRSLFLLSLVSLLLYTNALATDILYWPLGSEPSLLARVSYDPTSLKTDVAFHPPNPTADLVRIGLYTNKQWVGSLVAASSLTDNPTFRLHLDAANEVYHVSLSSDEFATTQVDLVFDEPGTRPHLNRPIVVGPDGATPEPEEKTLLQK
ncbi:unnamed protein product [Penicillium olsonii]|uniref:Uncharacterized protein n=1 Tax=Penicillium olsonii TaxID=99116 RepID=A0A9W4MPZ9_PENOL|nr:unnamed protein product [Penicillium olsonii]CAG7933028.1 unnamed protein product [Penicillium olsonii]CAG8024361.1 unnamed protein product [Penicillium olsonii]CAG8177626.1 unnamed protein product [Penicillium olsonii]CAG8232204.1 unnamed protein product [Penicillium olsonii]